MSMANLSIDELKGQARRLRRAMAETGAEIAHSAALELVAKSHGQRDWNTLAALAGRAPDVKPAETGATEIGLAVAVDGRVRGAYLGQPFEGRVISLTRLPAGGLYRISVKFDAPVDVVTFESFSALRYRADAVIDASGVSPRRTSNGVPQMVVAPVR